MVGEIGGGGDSGFAYGPGEAYGVGRPDVYYRGRMLAFSSATLRIWHRKEICTFPSFQNLLIYDCPRAFATPAREARRLSKSDIVSPCRPPMYPH